MHECDHQLLGYTLRSMHNPTMAGRDSASQLAFKLGPRSMPPSPCQCPPPATHTHHRVKAPHVNPPPNLFFNPPPSPPTQWVDNQPTDP